MHKKILAACAVIAAFAAMPAVASASPELQTSGGVKSTVGETISATDTGNIVFTSNLGSVTCSESTLHGQVVANSGKLIEGTIESASFTGNGGGTCSSWTGGVTVTPENLHWCIKSSSNGKFSLRGGGCNEAERNLAFTLHFSFGSCKFERSGGVAGTYGMNVSPVILTLTGEPEFTRVSGGFGCPSSGKLHAEYEMAGHKIV